MTSRPLLDPTKPLVASDRIQFGRFSGPLASANLLDGDYGRPWSLPRPLRNLRLKEWQAVQVGTERYFMILALFDAKIAARVQARIYDRRTHARYAVDKSVRPGAFANTDNLLHSDSSYRGDDFELSFRNRLDEDKVHVSLHIPQTRTQSSVDAAFTFDASAVEPLVVSIPLVDGGAMYSHKGLHPVTGQLRVGDELQTIGPGEGYGLMDHHKGYYGRKMRWDWVTAGGHIDGSLCGFNLTRNMSTRIERHHENGFWIDGAFHELPPPYFIRDSDYLWKIRDREGLIELDFEIESPKKIDMNAIVVRSDYEGPFGKFTGYATSRDGVRLDVQDMFGMGERFLLIA